MKAGLIWGRYTWALFHFLCENMKDEYVGEALPQVKKIIWTVCSNLPCPVCRRHAMLYLSKPSNGFKNAQTKTELRKFMYEFHNLVNVKTRKNTFDENNLTSYSRIQFDTILVGWQKYFSLLHVDQYTFREETNRKKIKMEVIKYLKERSYIFV